MKTTHLELGLVLGALAAAGCGSSGAKADDAGAADASLIYCGDPNQPIDPTAAIDDMEDRDFIILNRSGAWWAGGDTTPGGAVVPSGDAAPEPIPGGRCGSMYASHVTGHGFNDWGAVLSMSMRYGSVDASAPGLLPYDAHFRQGITFWARVGDTSTNQVRYSVSDRNSRPEGGVCVDGGGQGTQCYDNFGVQLTKLDTTWRQYRIPFGGLTQRNFGVPEPSVDTSAIYTVEFGFAGGSV